MTPEEVFDNAWECTVVALYELEYQSADESSLSTDEIRQLTHCIREIAAWHYSQKERCQKELQVK
jgi:hypothetical protein